MAYELVMPRLGWTMEEGTLVEWLKHDGDTVQSGEIVFTVESDKAVNEIEALEGGILRIPPDSPAPGTTLPIGALLGYIIQPGEAVPFEQAAPAAPAVAPEVTATPAATAAATSAPTTNGNGAAVGRHQTEPAISPRARRIAVELGVDWQSLIGSGSTGRIVERDVRAAATTAPVAAATSVRATPLARRVAQDLDVDLQQLASSTPGKRISRADVEAASQSSAPQPATAAADVEIVPLTAVRRITAERMTASAHTVAPVTLTSEVDATELVRLRKQLKADSEAAGRPVPSYNDLLARLCAEALADYPYLNASWHEDHIALSKQVHIGIAVDGERGLLVPVLRDVQGKSVRRIAVESRDLIERARQGQLKSDEMRGSTFTITNLGMFGIDAFTPIINLPECAILGVGRIVPKQVVIDADTEQLAIRHMMFLSLTFDHRVVDGADAAKFLNRVRQFIEQPYLWLV
ncbi:MAG: 2-oxo acid dehydrogenase subunit E2 [Anaerolineae bacterium]|nr:2-oxo acid dehydrogenase subunit E2 [Anaerolineae bacterium]